VEGSRNRSGTRTPMQWNDSANAGFSTAPAAKIYIPQDPSPQRLTVSTQEKNPNSLLNYTRALLHLRASIPALGNEGAWEFLSDTLHPYPMVYQRSFGSEKYIIEINPTDKPVEVSIPVLKRYQSTKVLKFTGEINFDPRKLFAIKMKPVSAVILKVD
jgi:maltose alpha-D-glucosyltransferase/alpha-amylase